MMPSDSQGHYVAGSQHYRGTGPLLYQVELEQSGAACFVWRMLNKSFCFGCRCSPRQASCLKGAPAIFVRLFSSLDEWSYLSHPATGFEKKEITLDS